RPQRAAYDQSPNNANTCGGQKASKPRFPSPKRVRTREVIPRDPDTGDGVEARGDKGVGRSLKPDGGDGVEEGRSSAEEQEILHMKGMLIESVNAPSIVL
ncbi:hypothetical protein AMECASPLE_024457, partial [Ameca splendens]